MGSAATKPHSSTDTARRCWRWCRPTATSKRCWFVYSIDRGLAGYCIEQPQDHIGRTVKIDIVSTAIGDGAGFRHNENAYWNFNVGLTLRFFAALRGVARSGTAGNRFETPRSDGVVRGYMRWQLRRSITKREGCVEIRTSIYSGETNSETQPWVMLGLIGHPYD